MASEYFNRNVVIVPSFSFVSLTTKCGTLVLLRVLYPQAWSFEGLHIRPTQRYQQTFPSLSFVLFNRVVQHFR